MFSCMAQLQQKNCMQKQLNFSFLKVIRNKENIKPDINWQSESVGVYIKD